MYVSFFPLLNAVDNGTLLVSLCLLSTRKYPNDWSYLPFTDAANIYLPRSTSQALLLVGLLRDLMRKIQVHSNKQCSNLPLLSSLESWEESPV